MSNPQQDQDEYGRRKSKRQRVPNSYYTAGINELKKITLKNQSKKNRNEDDQYYSSQDQRNMSQNIRNHSENYHNNQRAEGSGPWLTCIMPKSNKQLKVQVVLDSNNRSMQTEQVRAREEPTFKQTFFNESQGPSVQNYNSSNLPKKAESQGGLNLLSLFEKVIKNVSDEVPSPVKNPHISNSYHSNINVEEPIIKYSSSITQKQPKQPIIPPAPKRVVQEDKDGRILSLQVDQENKALNIKHSQLGECSVPIQVEPPCWKIQEEKTQQQLEMTNQLKKKLASNLALLKSIAIYN